MVSNMSKIVVGKEELEDRARSAVRGTVGNYDVQTVTIKLLEERDAIGRNWTIASIEPPILNQDASFRAYQAGCGLADKFDLAE